VNTVPQAEAGGRVVEAGLSVFMSNYNHARFLPAALNALLTQSVKPGRVHIIDDASTDDSREIIESYVSTYSGTVEATFLERNRGFATNFKDWLENDMSEFIFIAAADDLVAPGLLEKSLALLRRFPDAGLCSAGSRLIDELGRDVGRFRSRWPLSEPGCIPPHRVRTLLMTEDGWFMGNTTIYRGTALRAVGFEVDLGAFADGFACRVVALRHGACFLPEDLGHWRRMESGMAVQATTSPALVHSVIARATTLMTECFANDFPVGYARRWRRRWLFAALSTVYTQSAPDSDVVLRQLLAPLMPVDRFALQTLRFLPATLARWAVFLWLRPFDIPAMIRRALHVRTV
jgi:glycosyltransferase involved in cell wall biosynthesis